MVLKGTIYQAHLADSPLASPEWVRGELEGDIAIARGTVWDPVIMQCIEEGYPKLSPKHDAVLYALAKHFTQEHEFLYITHDQIGEAAHLPRQTIGRSMRDLESVGRIESQEVSTQDGHRAKAYRLTDKDRNWVPVPSSGTQRMTVKDFHHQSELTRMKKIMLELSHYVPESTELPEEIATFLETLTTPTNGDIEEYHTLVSTGKTTEVKAAVQKKVNSGLENSPDGAGTTGQPQQASQASESQLMRIYKELDRAGLSEQDILASWPDIRPGVAVPPALEAEHLTKTQAHHIIRWMAKQPNKEMRRAQMPPHHPPVCTCDETVPAVEDLPTPDAQECWSDVLATLKRELQPNVYETWLEGTEGRRFEGMDLLVRVPSDTKMAWLEQRMYQTILRALRETSGQQFDIYFEINQRNSCPLHGSDAQHDPTQTR